MTETDEVGRLEARLDRERRARRQAEQIAERGMRELWETNRELQLRIDARTGRLERELAALALVHRSTVAEVASTLAAVIERAEAGDVDESVIERLRRLAGGALVTPAPDGLAPTAAIPIDVADDVLERWQRVAARSGQLLSVEADESDPALTMTWDRVIAALDVTLASVGRHGPGGAVEVRFLVETVEPSRTELRIEVRHAGIIGAGTTANRSTDRSGFGRLGDVGAGLVMAAELTERTGGRLHASVDGSGLVVRLSFPTG